MNHLVYQSYKIAVTKLKKEKSKETGSDSASKPKSNSKSTSKKSKPPTRYQLWRARVGKMIDDRIKEESKRMVILKFFIAPILCLFASIFLFLILDYGTFSQVGGLMLAYFFPPLGKESVIPIGVSSGEITIPIINQHIVVNRIDPLLMALSIAFVDIVTAIFLLWNYDFAKLIPLVGPWMEKVENKGGKQFKDNTWLEGLAFFGLVLFVMFPFQGSGGVGTSIVGRVIGFDKYKVVLAISIGALTGCLLIAYLTDAFIEFFKNNLQLGIIVFIIIIVVVTFYLIYKKKNKKANKEKNEK